MTTDNDVDIFLEHFGTRGMKWGVRKPKSARTESQKSHAARNKKLKVAGGALGVAAAAIVGGLLAKKFLNSDGNQSMRAIKASPIYSSADRRNHVHQVLQRNAKVNVATIRRSSDRSPSVQALNASVSRLIREANQDLRNRDNDLNTPFSQRSYLPEWRNA